MTLYHVEIRSSALHNHPIGLAFRADEAELGAAIAAVLAAPRWVSCWVGLSPSDDDAERVNPALLERIVAALSQPFVERAVVSADDPTGRAHALRGAEMIIGRVGGEMRERAGAVEIYLPGRDEPEVVLMYATAQDLN